jgi:hypothetical protein
MSEHGGDGKQCVPDSGDAIWWSRTVQKVGALQRRETVCIRQRRYVMVGPGGCRRLWAMSGEVNMDEPNSADALWSEKEGAGCLSTVEK